MLKIPEGPPITSSRAHRPPLAGLLVLSWCLFSAAILALSSGWIQLPELSASAFASELTRPRVASVPTRSQTIMRQTEAHTAVATRRPSAAKSGARRVAASAAPQSGQIAETPRVFSSGIYDRAQALGALYEAADPSILAPVEEPPQPTPEAERAPTPSERELERRELAAFRRALEGSKRPSPAPARAAPTRSALRAQAPWRRPGNSPPPEPAPRPPAARTAPSEAGSSAGCEAVASAYNETVDLENGNFAPPDITRQQYGAVLNNGQYFSHCNVPSSTTIDICAAVQAGRARGVTVTLRPHHAGQRACIERAVRGLTFPSHPKLDVVRTRF